MVCVGLPSGLGSNGFLQWLLFHVMWFSAVSAAFAAFAEAKHEDTLYPSVGFVCGVWLSCPPLSGCLLPG